MMQSLRRRFILVNMALVSLVLILAFSAVLFFNYQWARGETMDYMRRALIDSERAEPEPAAFEQGPERPQRIYPRMPLFVVQMDGEGTVKTIRRQDIMLSDEAAAEVAGRILYGSALEGHLRDLGLRYLKQDTPEGTTIVFADTSRETEGMANLLMTLALVGLAVLAAFFLISLFLSGMALRPVREAWDQQRRFVADASHELRTPLTVILANMGILRSETGKTVAQQIKWVDNTQAEAERMKELVEELLFLARSDDARVPPIRSAVRLDDSVMSCLLPFESIAFEQGITIESDIDPDVDVAGDESQLKRLVVILLDNACKYAGAGGAVSVRLEKARDVAILSVRNTGEPIEPEDLAHVFERFYRADSARARSEGGYGLGLAIAGTIVETHGGTITAESGKKAGTVFTVRLPVKQR